MVSEKAEWHSCFSPGNCSPGLLEELLVNQHRLLDRIQHSIEESIRTGAGHHWLLIGPRGIGKTHLLSVLIHRFTASQSFRAQAVMARMKEEERGVTSFLDWNVRILRAFERHGEKPATKRINLQEELTELTRLDPKQARFEAERLLTRFVGERKILLVVENLERLFSRLTGMNRLEQSRFRDLIHRNPSWAIIASSRALFEDVRVREAPFFGFFQVQHLSELDADQSLQLMTKLAHSEGRDQLVQFLQSDIGRGKMRALHHLTRGNPRLLVSFYQFIDGELIQDLATPFLKMIDNLTAYFQQQFLALPSLQQKIVDCLCERRTPVSVKKIAQACFTSHSTAASQLKRLSSRGSVHSIRIGRNSFYELRDPLFRICAELRENRVERTQLFVDFLEKISIVEELRRAHRSVDSALQARSADIGPEGRFAVFNAALAYFRDGRLEAGLDQIKNALRTGWDEEWEKTASLEVYAINMFILTHGLVSEINRLRSQQQEIFDQVSLPHVFAEGLVAALSKILSRPSGEITLDRLVQIRDNVVSELARQQQFQVVCQLFDAGVRYLESKDRRMLMGLSLEERTVLERLLKPAEGSR